MAKRESVDIVLKPEVARFYGDYTREYAKVADLFFGDPASLDKYVEMASDPYLRMIKRPRLHQALHDYNQSLGAPQAVIENVDRLRYDGAYCVLAWQQPYLAGGPLETFLKCLTAIKLCEKLNATGSAKFIPVLWAHADDHELSEVNRLKLPVGARLVEERLEIDETERPSEAVETGDAYDAFLARLRGHLEETPHREWLLDALAASKGANLGEHFARFMVRIFGEHGLVLACPSIFRPEISALLSRAVENPERIDRLLTEQRRSLEEKGYPCHTTWEDPLHLYRLSEGHPVRMRYRDGKFVMADTWAELAPSVVVGELKKWPQIYTNGVLLSPIEQDSCIPSVAHVEGPGGIEFFGVQKALFDDSRVAFPQVAPQVSATLVDARAARGLKALGKDVAQVIEEARKAAASAEGPPDHGAALAALRDEVLGEVEGWFAKQAEAAAETSRLGAEVAAAVAKEVARLGGPGRASLAEPRAKALAALERWGARARQVGDASAGLSEIRKLAETTLAAEYAPLAAARAELAKAAAALGEAAKPEAGHDPKKVASDMGRALDQLARATIEGAEKAAATKVADADAARLEIAPEAGLQEDTIATIHFLNQRGAGLVKEVLDVIDPFDFRHQVIHLG